MEIIKTDLEGVCVIIPQVFEDNRGYFFQSFSQSEYETAGINQKFVQDNVSGSRQGTIRGLHYQIGENAQGKLCQVISGKVLDVCVDLRASSPSFGKHFSVVLSEENRAQVWIPVGFAHGFSVLSNFAVFHYKCTKPYSKKDERGIIYNDTDLAIDWRVQNPIVSEKDLLNFPFSKIAREFA